MLPTIQSTIRRRKLIRPGDHVLTAVSGGADSVALAYALHFLKKRIGFSLTLAHLNHGLRGRAADADAEFVSELAWRLGLPCLQGRVDVRRQARHDGVSVEMAARQARYDFLLRAAREAGANSLATAHTADDQAETIILKLARGAGPQGLGGIPYRAERGGLTVIRPMLDTTHAAATGFLRRYRLAWREDRSNRDTEFLRNRVRHEIIPLLEKRLNPRIRRVLVRTAEVLREESEWLDRMAVHLLEVSTERSARAVLRVARARNLHTAVRRRLLRAWLAAAGMDPDLMDFDAVDRVDGLLAAGNGTRSVDLPGGWRAVRRYGRMSLERGRAGSRGPFRVRVLVPGDTILPEQGLRVTARWEHGLVRPARSRIGDLPAEASFGARAIGKSALFLRSWKAGDRIRPLGMDGSCKLQDLFTDQKVPRDLRAAVPVLECRGEVIWVPGYRIARGWEVPAPSAPSLRVRVRRLGAESR